MLNRVELVRQIRFLKSRMHTFFGEVATDNDKTRTASLNTPRPDIRTGPREQSAQNRSSSNDWKLFLYTGAAHSVIIYNIYIHTRTNLAIIQIIMLSPFHPTPSSTRSTRKDLNNCLTFLSQEILRAYTFCLYRLPVPACPFHVAMVTCHLPHKKSHSALISLLIQTAGPCVSVSRCYGDCHLPH